jgi:hypothetical protein
MEMEKYDRYYWKQNYKAAAGAKKKKSDVDGEGAVNEHTVQHWFKQFASDNISLEDEQHLR